MAASRSFPRVLKLPRSSFFLFGPRGSGKSTWARRALPKAIQIDLLDEALFQKLLAEPGLFADRLRAVSHGSWVWVDEVQRLPGLLNEVHRFIEERRLKFALTGSSARKLRHAGVNLLGGRAVRRTMYPFLPEELGEDFDLEEALRYGTLPIVWTAASRDEALEAYVQTYLKEEIQAEALVRNLPGFARFLPVAGLFHGQVLNTSGLARDAGVARMTVEGFLDILEDTLVAFRLPAFEGRLRVREKRHPKLYWVDSGLARAVKRRSGPIAPEERGSLLEGWVAATLRAYADLHSLCDEIYYWSPADAAKTEVDFLLRKGSRFVALEVKSSRRLSPEDFRGLRAIEGLEGLARRIVIAPTAEERKTEDGIEVWPISSLYGPEKLAATLS
jgi:uncharacterized protein